MTKQLNPGPRKDFLDAHPEEKKVAVATVRKITTEFDAIAKAKRKALPGSWINRS